MNYSILSQELVKQAGINKEIFDFNHADEKPIHEDNELIIFPKHEINLYYYSHFQYKENIKQRWKCVTLSIPLEIAKEFFSILNSIFEKYGRELIDINNLPDNFDYNDETIFYLVGVKNGKYYELDIAEREVK